ncbi:DHA2 family efflux MFS transporter permease subunit [Frankia sp. QA3]|uniref:DHA2 family efflux MFS transporter permease subunit n=1 Tax=Frankia sp. QA3 TaxID=710111 RepID=UPI000269C98A|nr:DHA2 family efflux MFS transporter permease subunit [Frankia sp. QA3]EIV94219.1 drug resistance transporter, EmrB/QacA subfamily [Frankia sp. QA3]
MAGSSPIIAPDRPVAPQPRAGTPDPGSTPPASGAPASGAAGAVAGPATPGPSAGPDRQTRLTLGVLVLGGLMVVLDVTITNVAIRSLSRDLHAPLSVIQWVTTGYTLALAVAVPMTAWLASRLGTRRVYIIALALFGLGSLLAGLAWNIGSLIAFRVLQGLGGGLVNPIAMTIAMRSAPSESRGRTMGVFGLPVLVGPLAGPTLGGWLVGYSWRWIFLINVPIALLAVPLALWLLPRDAPDGRRERLDVPGLALIGPGLAGIVYGLAESGRRGTLVSAAVLVPALLGLGLCAAFVARALRLRTRPPLVEVRLLGRRALASGAGTLGLFAAAYFGSMFILPLYWQLVRGQSPAATGLLAIPQALATGLSLQVASRLVDRVPPARVVGAGIVVATAGLLTSLLLLDADTPYWQLLTSMAVTGIGTGATIMPTITTALRHLPDRDTPTGSTLLNIINQAAVSIGTALTSVLLASSLASRAGVAAGGDLSGDVGAAMAGDVVAAFRQTLLLPVVLMAVAGVVALLLLPRPGRDDAPSVGERARAAP